MIDFFTESHLFSLLLAISIPLLFYWYSTRNHDYWKKRGIPFVKPFPLFGSHPSNIFKKNIEDVEIERYERHGRLYGYFEGSKPALNTSDPELLKKILVKDFQYFTTRRIFPSADPVVDKLLTALQGEDWKRVRAIVSPTFSTGKIKRVMSIFQECANTSTLNFKTSSLKGEPVDVLKIYGAFTMDVIASSAFSTKLDSHNDPENEFVKKAKEAFTLKLSLKLILFILMPNVLKCLRISAFNVEIMDFFTRITLEIIEERKKTGQTRNDFLQLLMDTAKEVSIDENSDEKSEDLIANYGDESINHQVFKEVSKKHLTMNELVAQCVLFFLAGYHTTSVTLGLATYQLALNPDIQEKLFEEIKQSLEENDGKLTYESIQKMTYLDNIISETLRMYPPIPRLDRTADADYVLGDTGITVTKGMIVGIPVIAMHRDPEFFPAPMTFNPDRFSAVERGKQIPYTYLPFGAGPRNCVAMRFALLELKVCLVHVFSNFEAKKCTETKIPLEFGRGTGLLQPKSVTLRMELRKDSPLKTY